MDDLPLVEEKKDLENLGTSGFASGIAGAGVLIGTTVLTSIPIVAVVSGAVIAFGGYSVNKKADTKSDKFMGKIIMGVGALTAATAIPIVGGFSSFILLASGVTLLGNAGYNLYKFFKRLRERGK